FMPARAISSATVAFGLVSIPVKLFPSVSPSDAIRFNTLHEACGTRVKQQFFCPKDEEVVPRTDTIKGYEFAKGQYVTFNAEELKAVEEQSTGGIDITEFVPIEKVDPLYYAKSYYLNPDEAAARAYHLLAAALRKTGLVALAKYAARGKQYLVLLRPIPEGIILQQLHYPGEVRSLADVGIPEAVVDEGELELAMRLIEQSARQTFNPEKYTDDVRTRVEAVIARKVDGEDITQEPTASPKSQVIDLMSALKESLRVEAAAERDGPLPADALREDEAADGS
ncbi:MAG: Ku protein, partial [Nannocystaceae bacterium]|nr:Ku protein [Nannocystaceae bacterium]